MSGVEERPLFVMTGKDGDFVIISFIIKTKHNKYNNSKNINKSIFIKKEKNYEIVFYNILCNAYCMLRNRLQVSADFACGIKQ